MEEEMRIRRIGKAMRVIKEKQSQEKAKSEIEPVVSLSAQTEPDGIEAQSITEHFENNIQDDKSSTSVLISIPSVIGNDSNSIQNNVTNELAEDDGNSEHEKTSECRKQTSLDEEQAMEISNECLNCGRTFPDQDSLCNHAIACSVQLQKYVLHLEKRRKEAKRYSMKRLEHPRRKLEFKCGSCGEQFAARNKLRHHITVR